MGTAQWAGGPIPWQSVSGNSIVTSYANIDVQCYDSNNRPVPKWPLTAPDYKTASPSQPTVSPVPGKPGSIQNQGNFGVIGEDDRGVNASSAHNVCFLLLLGFVSVTMNLLG